MSKFIDWLIDKVPSEDVIDLQFIQTDMKDITITPAEREEQGYYDAKCTRGLFRTTIKGPAATGGDSRTFCNGASGDSSSVPIGKQVR